VQEDEERVPGEGYRQHTLFNHIHTLHMPDLLILRAKNPNVMLQIRFVGGDELEIKALPICQRAGCAAPATHEVCHNKHLVCDKVCLRQVDKAYRAASWWPDVQLVCLPPQHKGNRGSIEIPAAACRPPLSVPFNAFARKPGPAGTREVVGPPVWWILQSTIRHKAP
jgi:hypothetical protein